MVVSVIYPVRAFYPKFVRPSPVVILDGTALRKVQRASSSKRQAYTSPIINDISNVQDIAVLHVFHHLLGNRRLAIPFTIPLVIIKTDAIIAIDIPTCAQIASHITIFKVVDYKAFPFCNFQNGARGHGNRHIHRHVCRRFRCWCKILVPAHKLIGIIYRRLLIRSNIRGEAGDSARHEIVIIQVRKIVIYKFDFVLVHRHINGPFDYGFPVIKLPVKLWNGIPFKNPTRQLVVVRHGCLGRQIKIWPAIPVTSLRRI